MINAAIAEDDFRVATVHEGFLTKIDGVKLVGKALNAEETIELLQNKPVDLLLLDVYMPDELGTDLLPEIRKKFPYVDVIMITAATEMTLLEQSIRNGIYNYLIKPVTLDKFTEVIEHYKQHREMLESYSEVDQSVVDDLLGKKTAIKQSQESFLPKGIDKLTLDKVKEMLKTFTEGTTAEEIGKKMGASRTTARRYLEYLISVGKARAELNYGVVGRPERKYYSEE
ncbi:response regulator [Virgibacillus ihumii]|uniref:response regulator n=1 Tax=Virgibacillus ihumii TaxID=2686091 RepID=UPI00157C9A01|nr:response regulator [Virgibacillus ihumii]